MTPKVKWLAREILDVLAKETGIIDPSETIASLAAVLAIVSCKATQRGTLMREMVLHEFQQVYRVFVAERDQEDVFGAPPTEKGLVRVGLGNAKGADDLPDVIRLDALSKRLLALAVRGSTEGERDAAGRAFVRRIAR